ncbi:MAG: hypothetical protein A2Z72_05235 [Omnitrophica bacterium RBG_13_46_9]|nr:MAG: hypothetical protein A2Z72_05235 [Omnitrophica bacterium RBG_13_46_9]
MIIFLIEILCIFILIMILSVLIIDERKIRQASMHLAKLKGYWDGSERRNLDRMNISLEVRYFMNGLSAKAKSLDITTKGIRIVMDEKFEEGRPLRLEIKLPDNSHIIRANGEVVWSKESPEDEKDSPRRVFNTGIKFYKFQAADEKKLFDFIHNIRF